MVNTADTDSRGLHMSYWPWNAHRLLSVSWLVGGFSGHLQLCPQLHSLSVCVCVHINTSMHAHVLYICLC